jgi:phage baseplate assembly protein W
MCEMTSEFLGVGWASPVQLDENGQIALTLRRADGKTYYEESVRQAIWMILGTARGERVMRPTFGCGIHDLVFATNSAGTAGRVATEMRQALIQWEPRIDIQNVTVTADNSAPNRLLIEIKYKVRATNNQFNLVYPFYLE